MVDKLQKILDKYNISIQKLHAILRARNNPDRLDKLLETNNITVGELEAVLKSSSRRAVAPVRLKTSDEFVKFGYFSDPHIGHKAFRADGFDLMKRVFQDEGVQFVVCPGDHLEGMSGRPGHIYELTDVGFTAQINRAAELYSSLRVPIYGIDGNHDQWYEKKNNGGVVVGEDLERRVKNFTNLGQDEGEIILPNGSVIKLFHGADGTAYADSYKLQKLIESFSGGEKPDVVFSGHYHKSLYLFRRNVHGFESGTLCGQTRWMRGKKIQAHQGFGIVDLYLDDSGIYRLRHEFFPLYERDDVHKVAVTMEGSKKE